jgi:hypothetical protein
MRGKNQKPFQPVHAVEDAATGLYLNLDDADHPHLAPFAGASHYATRLDVCTRIAEVRAPLPAYEVVRIDRP